MEWLEFGLVGSVVFALYYFQQIKMTLKERGFPVEPFSGWISDYKKFKELIQNETDKERKLKYQGILSGFHLAIVGMGVIAVFIFSGK